MSTNTKSQAENTTAGTANGSQNGITHAFRDLISTQLRMTQLVLDKSIGITQNVADHYQTQLADAVKLTQECSKAGWAVTENIKNTAVEYTDRIVRGFTV